METRKVINFIFLPTAIRHRHTRNNPFIFFFCLLIEILKTLSSEEQDTFESYLYHPLEAQNLLTVYTMT